MIVKYFHFIFVLLNYLAEHTTIFLLVGRIEILNSVINIASLKFILHE